jgi:hypothetical protein
MLIAPAAVLGGGDAAESRGLLENRGEGKLNYISLVMMKSGFISNFSYFGR